MPFFSHDIDFLGGRTTAEQIHQAWKGKITRPSETSGAPLIAKLEFKLEDGRRVIMDFLDETVGIKIVKGLSDSGAKTLRELLEPHIDQPVSHELPEDSGAITEPYTEEEAEQWIANDEKAMSEVSQEGDS